MKKLLFVFLMLFFVGCSVKTTPMYAVIKTPKIKISDQGFLKEGFGYKEIIIYKSALKPFKVTIKNSYICLNSKCMDKEKFVKEYLGENYPADIFDLIIEGKPIKKLGKITKIDSGFIQRKEGIFYKVQKDKVLFRDKNRNIIIMVKRLREKG